MTLLDVNPVSLPPTRGSPAPFRSVVESPSAATHALLSAAVDYRAVTVRGELDVATAPLVDRALAAACLTPGASEESQEFVLDLAELTFLDSFGLESVNRVLFEITGRGWRLRVTPPAASGPRRLMALAAREGRRPR